MSATEPESYSPKRQSDPRFAMTIFGAVIVPGPFSDDYVDLPWEFRDHRDGESARFRGAGLEAYVQDCDGDASYWELRDMRKRRSECLIASGGHDSCDPIYHFWKCLVDAEAALREEVRKRIRSRKLRTSPNPCDPADLCGEEIGDDNEHS